MSRRRDVTKDDRFIDLLVRLGGTKRRALARGLVESLLEEAWDRPGHRFDSRKDLEEAADWAGRTGEFAEHLIDLGWVLPDPSPTSTPPASPSSPSSTPTAIPSTPAGFVLVGCEGYAPDHVQRRWRRSRKGETSNDKGLGEFCPVQSGHDRTRPDTAGQPLPSPSPPPSPSLPPKTPLSSSPTSPSSSPPLFSLAPPTPAERNDDGRPTPPPTPAAGNARARKPAERGESEAFGRFWDAWPTGVDGNKHHRAGNRGDAWRRWNAMKLDNVAEKVIASVEAWKLTEQWISDEGTRIPAPEVWLRKTPWTAAPPPPFGAAGPAATGPPRGGQAPRLSMAERAKLRAQEASQ